MKKLIFAALFMIGGMVAVTAQTKDAKKAEVAEVKAVEINGVQSPAPRDSATQTSDKSIIANGKKLKGRLNKEKAKNQPMLQEAEPAKQEATIKIEKVE
ncbi:MAG: hypothetical protein ACRC0E_10505 [Soonwooa sp.]